MIKHKDFKCFNRELAKQEQVNSAQNELNNWLDTNELDIEIINIETREFKTGSSMTSSGSEIFESLRVWYKEEKHK